MVDLGDMAKNIAGAVDTSALQAAISEAVIYQVKGATAGMPTVFPYITASDRGRRGIKDI